MKLKKALVLIAEERATQKMEIAPTSFIMESSSEGLQVGNIEKILTDMAIFDIKDFLSNYVYKIGGNLAASTDEDEDNYLLESEVSLVTKQRVKAWAKKKIDSFIEKFSMEKMETTVVKKTLIEEIRKIEGYDSFKTTFFFDNDIDVIIKQYVKEGMGKVDVRITKSVARSLRGVTSHKIGKGVEDEIKKAIIDGDYSILNGLNAIEPIMANLTKKNKKGITVEAIPIKPIKNNAAYDLKIKFPYSREILFGIHIKLLPDNYTVASMGNKLPHFSSEEFKPLENFIKEVAKKLGKEEDYYLPYSGKENLGKRNIYTYKVKVQELVFDFLKHHNNEITDKGIVYNITNLCRVNHQKSLWVIVYPKGTRVSFSEVVDSVKKEGSTVKFINVAGDTVFRMLENGNTAPVLKKRRE